MSVPLPLNVEALTQDDGFDLLQDEWDQLLDTSDQLVFFLRWSWNRIWWRSYAPRGSRLLLITCRDEHSRLVGLAPFYWRQLRTLGIPHVREVLFIGTGIFTETSQFLDIVARRGYERLVALSVADYLNQRRDWDRVWLHTIPVSSTVLPHFREALGSKVRTQVNDRSHSVDTTTDWETCLARIGKSTRRNVRRYVRKLFDSHDCEFRLVETEAELEAALDALVKLHQARWQSRGEPGSFALPGFESFLREATRASLAERRLRVWTLSLDGRIAAVMVAFFENGVVYGFQQGFDPTHLKDSLGNVVSALCIKACIEDDRIIAFDFMGGHGQYKDAWTKEGLESVSLTWIRPGTRSRVFEGIESFKNGAKSFVRALIPSRLRRTVHRTLQRRNYSARVGERGEGAFGGGSGDTGSGPPDIGS